VRTATNASPKLNMTTMPVSATSVSKRKPQSLSKSLTTGRSLYLAGPIRGVKNFRSRFAHATALLRYQGWDVFNPVEQDGMFLRHGMPVTVRIFLEHDLPWICRWAHIVAFLPGWERSLGAQAEYKTALACDIPVWELPKEYCID